MTTDSYSYSTSVVPEQGFHFSWTTNIHRTADSRPCASPKQGFALHFSLPPDIFVDLYELDFQGSLNYDISYEPDLERPVWAVRNDIAVLNINVTFPNTPRSSYSSEDRMSAEAEQKQEFEVSFPIHARYGQPQSGRLFEMIQLRPPSVTLYCADETGTSPFLSQDSFIHDMITGRRDSDTPCLYTTTPSS